MAKSKYSICNYSLKKDNIEELFSCIEDTILENNRG